MQYKTATTGTQVRPLMFIDMLLGCFYFTQLHNTHHHTYLTLHNSFVDMIRSFCNTRLTSLIPCTRVHYNTRHSTLHSPHHLQRHSLALPAHQPLPAPQPLHYRDTPTHLSPSGLASVFFLLLLLCAVTCSVLVQCWCMSTHTRRLHATDADRIVFVMQDMQWRVLATSPSFELCNLSVDGLGRSSADAWSYEDACVESILQCLVQLRALAWLWLQ